MGALGGCQTDLSRQNNKIFRIELHLMYQPWDIAGKEQEDQSQIMAHKICAQSCYF